MNEISIVENINREINKELTKETANTLLATTFKGLTASIMKQAIMEGMIRGFTFQDFLQKNVYAIPFSSGYSLITSIDYSRKIGAKSGVVGKLPPAYVMDGKKIESCTVTIKKKIEDYIGDFSATVFFDEYYKAGRAGKPSLWDTKPRTMIAKVAEMHALRMACPEELSQQYIEEEMVEDAPSRIKEVKNMVEDSDLQMGNFLKHGDENKDQKKGKKVEGDGDNTSAEGGQTQGD